MKPSPTSEQILNRLDAAYRPGQLPEPAGGELFFAATKAKAMSLLALKLGILLGIALTLLGALAIYHFAIAGHPMPEKNWEPEPAAALTAPLDAAPRTWLAGAGRPRYTQAP